MEHKIPKLLPWQHEAWSRMSESFDRFPHATLLSGATGSGRVGFAVRLAAALLCSAIENKPCGECRNCKLFTATSHPDFHIISTELAASTADSLTKEFANRNLESSLSSTRKSLGSGILISQVRALIESAYHHPHIASSKVFLMYPAESMTISSANSLLKILEEPPQATYLILVSDPMKVLLPTITSRCQRFDLPTPDCQLATDWIAEQGGSPDDVQVAISLHPGQPMEALRKINSGTVTQTREIINQVVEMLKDKSKTITNVAANSANLETSDFLFRVQQFVCDLIRSKMVVKGSRFLVYDYLSQEIKDLAIRSEIKNLYAAF